MSSTYNIVNIILIIGATLSQSLVNAGVTSLEDIARMSPRNLERTLNKNPPFGNMILDTVEKLPRFKIKFNFQNHSNPEDENEEKIILHKLLGLN